MLRSMFFAAGSLLLVAAPAIAQDVAAPASAEPSITISGGVTGVSQYRFRGISLSDEKPAVQGTINLNHDSGFYVGTWASSLDGFGELGGSNLEVDLYGGYKKEVGGGFTADVGLVYYAYPGSKGGDFEFFEPYANVSHAVGPATAKVGVAFAPSQKALGNKSNIYTFGDVALPISGTPITLNSHIGWSKGETALTPGDSYIDWALGASAAWRQLTFGVSYVDTNINAREALSVGATKDIVDRAFVFSVGASF